MTEFSDFVAPKYRVKRVCEVTYRVRCANLDFELQAVAAPGHETFHAWYAIELDGVATRTNNGLL